MRIAERTGSAERRVADELTVAQTALTAVLDENKRIKDALRAWQTTRASHPGPWDRR